MIAPTMVHLSATIVPSPRPPCRRGRVSRFPRGRRRVAFGAATENGTGSPRDDKWRRLECAVGERRLSFGEMRRRRALERPPPSFEPLTMNRYFRFAVF